MITYRRTSILESNAQTLVNTVNCVGVMGKGIAKAFKERDPAMFKAYQKICAEKLLEPGKLWLWQGSDGWVLNFPTKIHWRNPSRVEWIEAGLKKFVSEYTARGIREVSFPRLGCGNGGLEWDEIRPLMEKYLRAVSIPVYIHDHMVDIGIPEHLEDISRRLKEEGAGASTFDAFLAAIKRVAELGGGALVELEGQKQFRASMDADWNLDIETDNFDFRLEREDLRGVWLSLVSGLLTREKAGWSTTESSGPLLSMLSVLPRARAIEIQRPLKSPELAVEFLLVSEKTSLTSDLDS